MSLYYTGCTSKGALVLLDLSRPVAPILYIHMTSFLASRVTPALLPSSPPLPSFPRRRESIGMARGTPADPSVD